MKFWWCMLAIVAVVVAMFAASREAEFGPAQEWECKGACNSLKNQSRKIDI